MSQDSEGERPGRLPQRLLARVAGGDGRVAELARHGDAIRRRMAEDRAWMVAAGLAFYWLLSIVPAFLAGVSLYALLADPATMTRHVEYWTHAAPDEVERLIVGQMLDVANRTHAGISVGLAFGVVGLLWSASRSAKGMMDALNVVYDVEEDRPMMQRRLIALAVATVGVVVAALGLGGLAILQRALGFGGGGVVSTALGIGRWPVGLVAVVLGLALAYRYAPNRDGTDIAWVSVGAVTATVLWALATVVIVGYAALVGFSGLYGSLGAVMLVQGWAFVTAYAVLLGGYVNVEMSHPGDSGRSR